MTWRRLRVLIEQLPGESATWTAIRRGTPPEEIEAAAAQGRPEDGRWSHGDMLLASLIDAVRIADWHFLSANSDPKKPRPKPPDPIRRPGWKPSSSQLKPPSAKALALLDAMLGPPPP